MRLTQTASVLLVIRPFFNTSYPGGDVNILGGSGSIGTDITNTGNGGNVNIFGGIASGSIGDNTAGGNVTIAGGNGFGTGSKGAVYLVGQVSCSVITASLFNGTASYSNTASVAITASFVSPSQPYVTLTTSSTNWVTCSLATPEQYVAITTGQAYSFTSSNVPDSGQVAGMTLFINNTATATSSLSFPTSWIWIGSKPANISSSVCGVLTLKAYDTTKTVAAFAVQY